MATSPPPTDTSSTYHPDVDHIRRQRTHRRGAITKLSKRLSSFQEKSALELCLPDVQALEADIRKDVSKHMELQEDIDRRLDHESLLAEEADKTKHEEIYENLIWQASKLSKACQVAAECDVLHAKCKELEDEEITSAHRDELRELTSQRDDLRRLVSAHKDNRALQAEFTEINTLFMKIKKLIISAAAPTTTPSTTSTTSIHPPTTPRMAPLNIQVPTYKGDPLMWRAFEVSLTSVLEHRGAGLADMDKFAVIQQAIGPEAGKRLVADYMSRGGSVKDLLDELRHKFGRPQLVIPSLVKYVADNSKVEDSQRGMQLFKERVIDHFKTLKALVDNDLSLFLPHHAQQAFQGETWKDWERLLREKLHKPTMEDLSQFVEKRLLWCEEGTPSHVHPTTTSSRPTNFTPSSAKKKGFTPAKCASCGEAHWLGRCPAFIALGIEERNRLVREKRLCLNCFSPSHTVRHCTNKHTCRHCALRHHTLLHRESANSTSTSSAPSTTQPTSSTTPPAVPANPVSVDNETGYFTCTVVARMQNAGVISQARVLLDHGSGGSFISEELASLLNLKRVAQDRLYTGFSQNSVRSKFYTIARLYSTTSAFATDPIKLSIIPHAFKTSPPSDRVTVIGRAQALGLTLSDTLLGGSVDVILGGEFPWDFCGESTSDGPYRFISTKFGYGAVGPLTSTTSVFTITEHDSSLKDDLAKLWSLDQVPECSKLNPAEQEAMDNFNNTTTYVDGRIKVRLPLKRDAPPLGNSRKQAFSRLHSNEKSLKSKDKLHVFNSALREYITMGHAHVIPQEDLHPGHPVYYMPVHGVFKDASSTTKVRPVFDASAKTTTGASLNDCLLVGPNLYPQLADVLLQFRQHPVGLSADISKMFREIRLDTIHQDLHRFLLRFDDNSIKDCRMERVTFGVASSPFLATQSLRFIANKFRAEYPRAAHLIETVFYVDDFVSGAADIQEADSIRDELCTLLSRAGMTLRKWRSNSSDFMDHTPPCLREVEATPLRLQDSTKTLGVHWDVHTDQLHVAVPTILNNTSPTKRYIASISASVFDVLGFFSPFTIRSRILLQECWKRNLQWDKPLPSDLLPQWKDWVEDLSLVKSHPLPRRYCDTLTKSSSKSLHGFADASTAAYGAVVYLRAVQVDGSSQVSLVTSKARVLPVKHTTVPKAELLGALMLAKLLSHVSTLLDIPNDAIHPWTDSAIVLYWLSKPPEQFKDRFVANRTQVIHDHLPHSTWRHVATQFNPADLASRGVAASALITSQLWWSGPPWLSGSPDSWPITQLARPPEAITVLSIRPATDMDTSQSQFLTSLWNKFSSIHTLERVITWIYRFTRRTKDKFKFQSLVLTTKELFHTRRKLLLLSQQQDFPEVFTRARDDKVLPKHHPLHKLLPTLKDGLLYLRSRVRNTSSPNSAKLLIPLHPKSSFTRLLLRTLHKTYLHPGVAALHSIVADKYYISGLRNLLKQLSRTCSNCQRAYARPLSQQLGMLPTVRTTPSPPFMKVGVDFAGPLHIRRGHTRKPTAVKCYISVFVCMATKAIHLDICASLSTEDFLATLTRFIARRGCPSDIYSDNGSNFGGAREEIRELEALLGSRQTNEKTSHFAQKNGIQWHNIPPRAPHFGGLWEAAVRMMKLLLKKNLSPHLLRYDELYTLVTEAESILNSRPLTPIKEDETTTGNILTAGHFLIGRPLRAPPTLEPPTGNINNLRRWRLVSRLKEDLWKTWLRSYLYTQQERNKWLKTQKPLQPGDLVYVKDEVLKFRSWPLARVTQTFPGDDGQVRAVKLVCRGKEYTRASQMLIPLLPDEDVTTATENEEQPQ